MSLLLTLRSPPSTLLLDVYGVAARAWSVRRIRASYTGPCIRVRRSSDNTELNIGFVNDYIDTAAIATFCTGTNGFVTTVYGQDSTGINAVQATTANQPRIALAGVVDVRGAFAGFGNFINLSTTSLSFTGLTVGAQIYEFVVAYVDSALENSRSIVAGDAGSLAFRVKGQNSNTALIDVTKSNQVGIINSSVFTAEKICQLTLVNTSTPNSITVYSDGVSRGTATSNTYNPITTLGIETAATNQSYDDIIFEVVIYDVDKSADRSAIESNQTSYFVGVASQTLTASLYTDADSFFAASITAGAVNLSPSLYNDTDTFYSASVSQGGALQALTASLYTDTDTFLVATINASITLNAGLFSNANTFYAATLNSSISLSAGLFTDADTFFTTALNSTINLNAGLFSDADSFFSASINTSVSLTPALYADSDTFYSASLTASNALNASLLNDADTFYAASISQSGTIQALTASLIVDSDTFYSAQVIAGALTLTPTLITDGDTFYAAQITSVVSLNPALFSEADTFYTAQATVGVSVLAPSFYVDSDTFYAAVASAGVISLLPTRLNDVDEFYSATVASNNNVLVGLFADSDTFYQHSTNVGAVNIAPSLFADNETFYEHGLTGGVIPLQYPLAGIEQNRPALIGIAYPLTVKQTYPINTVNNYPLKGIERDYP